MNNDVGQGPFRRLLGLVERIGVSGDDPEEVRLQKALLVGVSLMVAVAAVIWGGIYLAFDEPLAASIPLIYSGVSVLSIFTLALTGRYRLFRFSQLLLILLLPVLLMVTLGGFVNGSAVALWALLSPLGGLMYADRRQATWWLLAYLAFLVASGVLEFFHTGDNNLPTGLIRAFFVMNVSGVSVVAFVLLRYFSTQKDAALTSLSQEQDKSERLLLNVLPAEIADELKTNGHTIADHFDAASVLFADIVGSTSLTIELAPYRMVELLNEVFSAFDSLVEKYGVEKIRTIGDNYMVASGVAAPQERPRHRAGASGPGDGHVRIEASWRRGHAATVSYRDEHRTRGGGRHRHEKVPLRYLG